MASCEAVSRFRERRRHDEFATVRPAFIGDRTFVANTRELPDLTRAVLDTAATSFPNARQQHGGSVGRFTTTGTDTPGQFDPLLRSTWPAGIAWLNQPRLIERRPRLLCQYDAIDAAAFVLMIGIPARTR